MISLNYLMHSHKKPRDCSNQLIEEIMNNKSVSNFVAAAMDAALKSAEHKSLFGTQYKFASEVDENDAKGGCAKCKKESCECMDSSMSDDQNLSDDENDARKKKKEVEESSSSSSSSSDSSSADDDANMAAEAAFNVAIDSLLTASAALDRVGLEKSAAYSLKLASFVVEAKKVDEKAAKAKAKAKADKEKAKAKADKEKAKAKADKEKAKAKAESDSNAAKDKAAKAKAKEKAEKDSNDARAKAKKEKESKSDSKPSSSKK
jgi:hypothetical protein